MCHALAGAEDRPQYMAAYSQADLNRTALQLNQRPRKTLAFRCPAEVLNKSVALTG
jgi:IS30 family transposase